MYKKSTHRAYVASEFVDVATHPSVKQAYCTIASHSTNTAKLIEETDPKKGKYWRTMDFCRNNMVVNKKYRLNDMFYGVDLELVVAAMYKDTVGKAISLWHPEVKLFALGK